MPQPHSAMEPLRAAPRCLLVSGTSSEDILQTLLDSEQLDLVGQASSTSEALDLLSDLEPDLVLVDIDEEEVRNQRTVERILSARPGTIVVGLTHRPGAPWITDMVQSGLRAVVTADRERGGADVVTDVLLLTAQLGSSRD
jgi:DNA-binding NarL/FixJ family response regulator